MERKVRLQYITEQNRLYKIASAFLKVISVSFKHRYCYLYNNQIKANYKIYYQNYKYFLAQYSWLWLEFPEIAFSMPSCP